MRLRLNAVRNHILEVQPRGILTKVLMTIYEVEVTASDLIQSRLISFVSKNLFMQFSLKRPRRLWYLCFISVCFITHSDKKNQCMWIYCPPGVMITVNIWQTFQIDFFFLNDAVCIRTTVTRPDNVTDIILKIRRYNVNIQRSEIRGLRYISYKM